MTSLSVMPQGSPNPFRGGRNGRTPRAAVLEKPGTTRRPLDDTAMAEIARIAGVRRVWPVISRPVMLAPGGKGEERSAQTRLETGPAPDGPGPDRAGQARAAKTAGAGPEAAAKPAAGADATQ